LNFITQRKKTLAQELRGLIERVKEQDFTNKDLQNKISTNNNKYDEIMADLGGQTQIKKVKSAIVEIKKYLKEFSVNEGVMTSLLFGCS